ncbi:uncharacterized protein Tco025E_06289 [Trypanosoma conorhini]|uniref:Uncharacterized protein n=1 Tax=Trypanosoma conorhini TaxID=83891 RepID=A0A3R7P5R5_9TRYP|nr:uncharacterized protein Tco025E_06289 [Trypanosoma conorhini]RNF13194.1 hypothetical protein Tco025E_06289 [Trypanosoma conorhini]
MSQALDRSPLPNCPHSEAVMDAARPKRPPSVTPPLSSISAETARKHRNVRRLLANVQREEGKVKSMQARLNTLLKERSRREEELQTAIGSLPTSHAIADLKMRLRAARENIQNSAKKINDADVYFALAAANAKGNGCGEARRRREYMGLKRAIHTLQGEVSNLKLQLHEISSNVKRNDVSRNFSYSNEKAKNDGECLNASSEIDKLKREKRMWEGRVREAAAAWKMAKSREARVTRILESLKKRMANLPPPSVGSTRTIKVVKKFNPVTENAAADSFIPPLESGSLLAVSLSRRPQEASASETCPRDQDNDCLCWAPLRGFSGQAKKVSFLSMGDGRGNTESREEKLKRQVEELEVKYARMKRRVSKMREGNDSS